MDINEVKQFIESNKGNQDVVNFVRGLYSTDGVATFLDSEDGKKVLQPRLDSHFSRSLETWKANNLTKIIEDEISKKYPAETEEQKRIKKIETELAEERSARVRAELRNKMVTALNEKKLPLELLDFVAGDNEEVTNKRVEALEKVFKKTVDSLAEERFKSGGRAPGQGGTSNSMDDLEKQYNEAVKNGNTALMVALKRKIFEEQNKK
jgi:hypothetical protein